MSYLLPLPVSHGSSQHCLAEWSVPGRRPHAYSTAAIGASFARIDSSVQRCTTPTGTTLIRGAAEMTDSGPPAGESAARERAPAPVQITRPG